MTPAGLIGIVGTGLIGGSVGLAQRHLGRCVLGYDVSPQHAARARALGLVDDITSLESLARTCELVVVAVPPRETVPVADELLRSGAALVVDTCSVKSPVVDALGSHPNLVPSHPMAGSCHSGPAAADRTLFAGRTWAITPGLATAASAVATVEAFVRSLDARPVVMDAASHDSAVAATSHLVHLVAAALCRVVAGADEAAVLAGPGFDTTTRVAGGSPGMWAQIVEANDERVLAAIRSLRAELDVLDDIVSGGDVQGLVRWLTGGVAARHEVLRRAAAARDGADGAHAA